MTKPPYSLIQEALNTTFGMSVNSTPEKLLLRKAAWAEYDEMFKAYEMMKNFWWPIEEFIKEYDSVYLLFPKKGSVPDVLRSGFTDEAFDTKNYRYFAKISDFHLPIED